MSRSGAEHTLFGQPLSMTISHFPGCRLKQAETREIVVDVDQRHGRTRRP